MEAGEIALDIDIESCLIWIDRSGIKKPPCGGSWVAIKDDPLKLYDSLGEIRAAYIQ